MRDSIVGLKDKIIYIYKQVKELSVICKAQGTYSRFSYIFNREKKILYLINAKVASSSIKASILQLDKKDYDEDYNRIHADALKWTKYISDKNRFISCYRKYYKFTFVRNPYERLISCYENKYHTDKKSVGKTLAEFQFDSYPFGFLKKDKGFSNFVLRVCLIPDKFADEHFRSQYFQVYTKDGKCLVDYVGHYENIEEEYEVIRQKYDFSKLPHYNKATQGNWQDYYNPITAWVVYKRFKKDFIQFGYETEYQRLRMYMNERNLRIRGNV